MVISMNTEMSGLIDIDSRTCLENAIKAISAIFIISCNGVLKVRGDLSFSLLSLKTLAYFEFILKFIHLINVFKSKQIKGSSIDLFL